MGADLKVIIGHNLSTKDIVEFPCFLSRNKELRDVYTKEIQSKIAHKISIEQALENLEKEYNWENITENDLLNSWANNEDPHLADENCYIIHSLNTYFGLINFNRRTIEILYLPEHKYANLFHESHRKFIFTFSKTLAKFLRSNKIVYCSDSGPTEIIETGAIEGMSIESIINLSIEKFGLPSEILDHAIANRFIIDDIDKRSPY